MASKYEKLKSALTWQEWKELGRLLFKCCEAVVAANDKKGKMRKETRTLRETRSILDDVVFALYSEKETQELTHVMYPGSGEKENHVDDDFLSYLI